MYGQLWKLAKSLILPAHLKIPSHIDLLLQLEELKTQHPNQLTVIRDGKSRKGKDLISVEIGHGGRIIAISAGAHSDEPTGTLTSLHLIKNLLTNPIFRSFTSRYRFVFHPLIDPDGAAVNANWSNFKYDFKTYLLHGFRNSKPADDCEHGIPVSPEQQIRPELQFFKNNIDNQVGRIDYYITLHTTHRTGGCIFIISPKGIDKNTINILTRICRDFGVPVMDIDLHGKDGMEYIAPGFLSAPSMSKLAKKYIDRPEIYSQIRMPTYEYVQTSCGTTCALISELPYVFDETLRKKKETSIELIDVKTKEIEQKKEYRVSLKKAIDELGVLGVDESNIWFDNYKYSLKKITQAIRSDEAELQRWRGIKAKEYEVNELDLSSLWESIEISKLYMKALEKQKRYKSVYDNHMEIFDEAYENLCKLISIEVVSLDTQVRIQTAMVFSRLAGEL